MKNQQHLPIFGIGPLYAVGCAALTLSAYLLDRFQLLPRLSFHRVNVFLKIVSTVFILAAACLWLSAVIFQKIDKQIKDNHLVTTGAYAWVRNPIYSAIMLVMWAVLAWTGNLYLLLLYPVYPLFMTILVKNTEEKWLIQRYGQAYRTYCKKVNRCIPWIPRR